MRRLPTVAFGITLVVASLICTSRAEAKTPPPVTITVTTTCLVSGLLASDYRATATLTGTTGPVDLRSDGKGLLASAVTLPGSVAYFGPVGVKTDDLTATLAGTSRVVGSVQVKTPCVKAAQGSA